MTLHISTMPGTTGKRPSAAKMGALSAAVFLLALAGSAMAKGDGGGAGPSLLPGGNSKEPVNIEADRLEYFNKEQKAIYIGNVVVIQGETSMKCSKLTIYINRQDNKDKKKDPPKEAPAPAQGAGGDSVRHMDAEGPVTLISKDQIGTGDRLEYDKPLNKVTIIGHVVLTQGSNVTKGNTLTYDLTTGTAHIESGGSSGRVSGYFVPGSSSAKKDDKGKGQDDTSAPKPKKKRDSHTVSRQKQTE